MRLFDSRVRACLFVVASVLSVTPSAIAADRHVFEHEFVLGTSLQIQVDADSPALAQAAEANVLAEIARLEKVYSRYSADSELSRWQAASGQATRVSTELLQVLEACDHWKQLSQGAFNPAVQSASLRWKQAEQQGQVPTAEELSTIAKQIQRPSWKLDRAASTATPLAAGPLTLDAIAKGTILDQAARAGLSTDSGIHGVIVTIGGDVRVVGKITTSVQITDPFHDAVNAKPLCTIDVHNQGVATSGGYRRGFNVAGTHYSHNLDPRTAQPVDHFASVTVVADTAETADALATTFSVLSAKECLSLASKLNDVHFLLVTNEGELIASPGWKKLLPSSTTAAMYAEPSNEQSKDAPATAATESGLLELEVQFELSRPKGAQYRRPYVAIWLEDADGFPVRTALLWITTKQPGPRWHRDLLRWYRNDRTRKLTNERDLIGVISEATRGPGQYKAVFDGKDDAGEPLKPGKYTLYLEAAREHGTYQLIKYPLELGTEPFAKVDLKGNVEIESASIEYRKQNPTSNPEAK